MKDNQTGGKTIYCPQHHIPLVISEQNLSVLNHTVPVIIGQCPKCKVLYISKAIIPTSRIFTVSGQRYQLLPTLSALASKMPTKAPPLPKPISITHQANDNDYDDIESFFLASENQVLQEIDAAAKAKREKQYQYKLQHEAEDRNKEEAPLCIASENRTGPEAPPQHQVQDKAAIKAARQAAREHQKQLKQEARRKKEYIEYLRTKAAAEARRQRMAKEMAVRKEQAIKDTRKYIADNNYGRYHVHDYLGGVTDMSKCPFDSEPLQFVERVEILLDNNPFCTSGYCCFRCNRLFIAEETLSRSAKKAVSNSPNRNLLPTVSIKPQALMSEPVFNSSGSTLYICKGTLACNRNGHKIESVTGVLENINGVQVRININYCCQCKQYFIDYAEYKHYRKLYGAMLGNFEITTGSTFSTPLESMADESVLHLCGYTVNQADDMSSVQRHKILSYLMDHGILGKADIINHLNFFIRTNGQRKNMNVAVTRWNDDIDWTRKYKLADQRHESIRSVKKHRR